MIELEKLSVSKDITQGAGEAGAFYLADSARLMSGLLSDYAGQVQMIYLDPPQVLGKKLETRVRVGEKDWKTGTMSLTHTLFSNGPSLDEYLTMMREVIAGAKRLLNETGTIFVHTDSACCAYVKLIMDEVFGMKNMLNEIVWIYQTGGRAKNYFSRRHDTILFYRKTSKYYFDMKSVEIIDPDSRVNHMKRGVDADGRAFRSIKSGGKTYTYYDDSPVYPNDVWSDVSHMQQRDPQRTGYDTQKPMALMRRIIKCSTKPGDLICDLFAGSGSALEAAHALGRRFVASDINPMSLFTVRKRLCAAPVEYTLNRDEGEPVTKASARMGIGHYIVTLDEYQIEPGLSARSFSGLDAVDNWSVGYIRDGAFYQEAYSTRSRATPDIKRELWLPAFYGEAGIRVGDVMGRNFYYKFNKDGIQ